MILEYLEENVSPALFQEALINLESELNQNENMKKDL